MSLLTEADANPDAASADRVIARALHYLEARLKENCDQRLCLQETGEQLHPRDVQAYLKLQLAAEINEVFAVLFFDNALRLLAFEKLFYGSISMATVHARVVVQRALAHNASHVILAHNHPAGTTKPSRGDSTTTQILKQILGIVDVQVVDHLIVAGEHLYSFAENGCL